MPPLPLSSSPPSPATMSSKSRHHHHPKLKPPPRPLFSCAMFRHCTQTVLSPTTTTNPPLPSSDDHPSPPPPPSLPPPSQPITQPPPDPPAATVPSSDTDPPPRSTSSSSSSSSSASHSFTQWRFPLHHSDSQFRYAPAPEATGMDAATGSTLKDMEEAFHVADLHFAAGNRLHALRLLERSLAVAASDPVGSAIPCPRDVMRGVVDSVLDISTARPAAKVLLALLLPEPNRRPAVEAGAAAAAVEAVIASSSSPSGSTTAERALAALELMCTVPEGAAEVRGKQGASGALAGAVERMSGRGKECGIGVLAAVHGGEWARAAPEEVGRTVVVALQGECSARGRRKGAQLLKALKDAGRLENIAWEDGR